MKNTILLSLFIFLGPCATLAQMQQVVPARRVIVFMIDGFGVDYLDSSKMPVVKGKLMKEGLYKDVKSMMPSVTNCNNASICCGTTPGEHGVVGNTFLNSETGQKEFLEDGDLVMAPTIFQRAAVHRVKSALFSSKLKTISLLSKGTEFSVCPETASAEWINAIGKPPHKYSREVNYWTLRCAIHTLKNRPDIKLLYIHTTDYAMHTWAPHEKESKKHLFKLDSLIGEIIETAPDAAVFVTADHGMNHKSRVWDLKRALESRGVEINVAISPLADKYPRHHSGYGGISFVYLNDPASAAKVKETLLTLAGIEKVYSREEAVATFHLMSDRIGDLVVLGDKDTVPHIATAFLDA